MIRSGAGFRRVVLLLAACSFTPAFTASYYLASSGSFATHSLLCVCERERDRDREEREIETEIEREKGGGGGGRGRIV